jgi:hypothetical protein
MAFGGFGGELFVFILSFNSDLLRVVAPVCAVLFAALRLLCCVRTRSWRARVHNIFWQRYTFFCSTNVLLVAKPMSNT